MALLGSRYSSLLAAERMEVIGVDVATVRKGHAAVGLDEMLRVTPLGTRLSSANVATLVAERRPEVVAIDSPPRPALTGKSRACERELMRAGIHCYFTPSDPQLVATHNFYAWMAEGFRLFQSLEPDYPLYCDGEPRGHALEIYPHGSAYVIGGGPEPKKLKASYRRQLLELSGLDTGALRTADELDAALAAYTGLLALRGEVTVLGNPAEGVIVLPVTASPDSPLVRPSTGSVF
jgi:predicted nuclease with RNAse H fold